MKVSATYAFVSCTTLLLMAAGLAYTSGGNSFQFAIIGDRTGEAVPGVYEEAWRETIAGHPAFAITVGDTIQGYNDALLDSEWHAALQLLQPFRKIPIYLTPGNHDIWSAASEAAYVKYSGRPVHYSFDYRQAHFLILDEHNDNALAPFAPSELSFLQEDLKLHAAQPLKFVFSHRPFWLINAALKNADSPMEKLAKNYGVQFVIAGHLHQMLHFDVDSTTYLSMPSAGGHLRASKQFKDGWFFAHTLVRVRGEQVEFDIEELHAPFGEGRVTHLKDWGPAGLQTP